MANYTIKSVNIGTTANDGTGDTLRTGFDSLNDNWTSLGNAISWDSTTYAITTTAGLTVGGDATVTGNAQARRYMVTDNILTAEAIDYNSTFKAITYGNDAANVEQHWFYLSNAIAGRFDSAGFQVSSGNLRVTNSLSFDTVDTSRLRAKNGAGVLQDILYVSGSTDRMIYGSGSGVLGHAWNVSGSNAATLSSTGLDITNDLDVGGAVTVSGTAATINSGTGSPEGVLTAPIGSLYTRTDGGASTTLYVKESGTGSTGWVAK